MKKLNAEYWNDRYAEDNFPWDAGAPTTPLVEYIDQLQNKNIRILLPGAGAAHEGGYLHQQGFQNIHVLDWSGNALDRFHGKHPDFQKGNLICADFFEHSGQYDLILEQTFFCALPPAKRDDWVQQMHRLLAAGGKVAGVMFDFPLEEKGPPWGGSTQEYKDRFEPLFKVNIMESCRNSIKPRAGKEIFVEIQKN